MLLIQRPPVRGVDYSLLLTHSCYYSIHTYSMIFPFLLLLSNWLYIWEWERNFSGYFCGLREEWSLIVKSRHYLRITLFQGVDGQSPSPETQSIVVSSYQQHQIVVQLFWRTMDYCQRRLIGDGISETFLLSRLFKSVTSYYRSTWTIQSDVRINMSVFLTIHS